MKSAAFPDENDAVELDLALSIGGTFRNFSSKSPPTGCGDGETKRKRVKEDDDRNPPLKREKNHLQDVGSHCPNKPDSESALHFVPILNGFGIPCVSGPYWAAGVAAINEKTLPQPVAGRRIKKIGSCGSSPVCSSSVVSDNYQSSSSHEGGGSNYTRSNSSISSSDRQRMRCPNRNPNPNDTTKHDKPESCRENMIKCREKIVEAHVPEIKKEPITASNKDEVVVPSRSSSMSTKNGKPPKPQIQRREVPSLKQMPCVTTTGIGPNGRTVTGFLYRYSKLEVSIVCVCHGESFSPAEFVKHAGGGEISHPLRHITVLPTNGKPSATR